MIRPQADQSCLSVSVFTPAENRILSDSTLTYFEGDIIESGRDAIGLSEKYQKRRCRGGERTTYPEVTGRREEEDQDVRYTLTESNLLFCLIFFS